MHDALTELEWNALVTSISLGDCVLMLGADAITAKADKETLSMQQLLARELFHDLPGQAEQYASLNPAQLAQVFKDACGTNALRSIARQFFGRWEGVTPEPPLSDLAALPFKLVIDTTPMNQMERAFRKAGKDPQRDWYHARGHPRGLDAEDISSRKPLIYHIFGSTKELKSIVLAENDLLDLLVSVIAGNPPLPNRLRAAFGEGSTMLFVGFGVRYLSLRILLHVLNKGQSKEDFSFALEDIDQGKVAMEGPRLFFRKGHGIRFVDMEPAEFVRELRRRVEAEGEAGGDVEPRRLGGKAPQVFLSYCSENEAQAKSVAEQLEGMGIGVWRDKDALEPGERWNKKVLEVIDGGVTSFVVLQSQELANRRESYAIQEMRAALQRNERMVGADFVIPVRLDDSDLLGDLKPFHVIDARKQEDLEKLAKRIRRSAQELKKANA